MVTECAHLALGRLRPYDVRSINTYASVRIYDMMRGAFFGRRLLVYLELRSLSTRYILVSYKSKSIREGNSLLPPVFPGFLGPRGKPL